MTLPANKQPVVRPGNKMTSFGWPFHGKVTDVSQVGTLPLDPPASPATKTFVGIERQVTEVDSSTRWYSGWNVCNTTKIQRPGWAVPGRSAEQLLLDADKGHKWKPYMTIVGPHNRLSGSTIDLRWTKWVYIDSTGAAYLISYTTLAADTNTLNFTFRISEMVMTVTRDPDERVVTPVALIHTGAFSDTFRMIIMDRTNTGDKVLLHQVAGTVGLRWDLGSDLPRYQVAGPNDLTSDYEIQVTGDGIDNIAFTVNKDPFDEKAASIVNGVGPLFHFEQILGFFYDDTGARLSVFQTIDDPVTGVGTFTLADPDNGYSWTQTRTTTVDWGGFYSSVRGEQIIQTASFSPYTNTQDRYVEGNLVDSDTVTSNPGVALTYNVVTDTFEQTGGPGMISPATTRTLLNPFIAIGERIRRIAQGYLQTTGVPASGTVIEDIWLDKKTGTVIASLSGWSGVGTTGFFEFAAYDPEVETFDSVVFSVFPIPPAAFDLKWYV